MKAYQLSKEEIASHFSVNITTGLSTQEVHERLKKFGHNTFPVRRPDSYFKVFLRQFKNPLIYILLLAAAVIFFVGQALDAFIISGVLLFNAILGTIQEGRTRTILEKLALIIKGEAIVVRDGQEVVIDEKYIVPGDILILQEGAKVSADVRIIEAHNLQLNEAMLTGESSPVVKTTKVIEHDARIHDQFNMAFQGTYALTGFGKGIVVATGSTTELGKLNKIVEKISPTFPLQQELQRLSHWILIFIFVVCLALFVLGFLTGKPWTELLVALTALFICVIPEGLPVVLTLVLVNGAYRMAKQKVLIKRLQAVEALGRIDVIMIDKTGTLTRNEMMVTNVVINNFLLTITGDGYKPEGNIIFQDMPFGNEKLTQLGNVCVLLNRSLIRFLPQQQQFQVKGEPTEAALFVLAQKIGVDTQKIRQEYVLMQDIPFDPEIGYHAACYEYNNQHYAFMIGSPEVVMRLCNNVSEGSRTLLNELLQKGLRVVAIAMKQLSEKSKTTTAKYCTDQLFEMSFLGLCGMQDVIRSNVQQSVQEAKQAGLRVVMATGDHLTTALYVAHQVNFLSKDGRAIEGDEFNALSAYKKEELLSRIDIFARVSPAEKYEIIKLFHALKKTVAMTGDGANDVPSMMAADIGIAMGVMGTEIAKEAADVVLMDDSFFSIMYAVRQGRSIFYALRRVVLYFFATNFGEILVVLYAIAANLPLPILAAQILWLNLVTDGFLDVALAMEPEEIETLMNRWKKENLITGQLLLKVIYMAIPMGIGSVMIFYWYLDDLVKARTVTLLTMAMFQWFNAWNCRSEYKSIFQLGFFKNKWLILATFVVLVLQVAIIYTPFLQPIFSTIPLDTYDWYRALAVSSSILFIEEGRKLIVRFI